MSRFGAIQAARPGESVLDAHNRLVSEVRELAAALPRAAAGDRDRFEFAARIVAVRLDGAVDATLASPSVSVDPAVASRYTYDVRRYNRADAASQAEGDASLLNLTPALGRPVRTDAALIHPAAAGAYCTLVVRPGENGERLIELDIRGGEHLALGCEAAP